MQRVSTHTHSMIPVFLRLLAGIDYLLIAEATTDFILLLLIHLGKVDHLSVINFCGVNTPCSLVLLMICCVCSATIYIQALFPTDSFIMATMVYILHLHCHVPHSLQRS